MYINPNISQKQEVLSPRMVYKVQNIIPKTKNQNIQAANLMKEAEKSNNSQIRTKQYDINKNGQISKNTINKDRINERNKKEDNNMLDNYQQLQKLRPNQKNNPQTKLSDDQIKQYAISNQKLDFFNSKINRLPQNKNNLASGNANHYLSPVNKYNNDNNNNLDHQRKFSQKIQIFQYKSNVDLSKPSSQTNIQNSIKEVQKNIPLSRKESKNSQTKKSQLIHKKQPRLSEPVYQSIQNQEEYNFSEIKLQSQRGYQQIKNKYSLFTQDDNKKIYNSNTLQKKQDQQLLNVQRFKKNKQIPSPNMVKTKVFNQRSQNYIQQKQELKVTDFIKGKQLGSGKFGTVQVVKHKKTGFVCAMKAIPKAMIIEENIINQFTRQIKIQSCLDHPNIIKLYGFFDDSQNIYLLMQLGADGHLYGLLKQRKKFNQNTVIYVMRQLCQALKYLHNQKIIHRDLKPQNIVFQHGTLKICDFGWSVSRGGNQLRSTFCGTPLYVSPEILKGHMYDEKIDIWSIGILAYELLVGDIPFEITTEDELIKIIKQEIVFPQDCGVSNQAKDFVLKILKKNPNQRLKIQKLLEHPFLQRFIQPSTVCL